MGQRRAFQIARQQLKHLNQHKEPFRLSFGWKKKNNCDIHIHVLYLGLMRHSRCRNCPELILISDLNDFVSVKQTVAFGSKGCV